MSTVFYVVRDGDRTQALAAHVDGKLFCYIPNVDAFVYNKPLSVDFSIDRNKQYNRVDAGEVLRIIEEGCIGRIDDCDSQTVMDWAIAEPQRLSPTEVLYTRPGERNRLRG